MSDEIIRKLNRVMATYRFRSGYRARIESSTGSEFLEKIATLIREVRPSVEEGTLNPRLVSMILYWDETWAMAAALGVLEEFQVLRKSIMAAESFK